MAPNHETLKCSTIHVELMPIIALLSMQSFSFHNDMTHGGTEQPPPTPQGYSFIYFLCPKEAVKVSLVIEQQRKRSRKERGELGCQFCEMCSLHIQPNRV